MATKHYSSSHDLHQMHKIKNIIIKPTKKNDKDVLHIQNRKSLSQNYGEKWKQIQRIVSPVRQNICLKM